MLQWILPSGLVFTDDWLAQLPVNAANSSSYLFVFLYSSFARSAAGGPCTACWGSGAALHGQAGTSIFLHLLVLFSRHRQGAYLSCRARVVGFLVCMQQRWLGFRGCLQSLFWPDSTGVKKVFWGDVSAMKTHLLTEPLSNFRKVQMTMNLCEIT